VEDAVWACFPNTAADLKKRNKKSMETGILFADNYNVPTDVYVMKLLYYFI